MAKAKYRSKYSPLWAELDALDIYETWHIPDTRFNVPKHDLGTLICRGGRGGKFRSFKTADGILFVRIK